MKTSLLNSLLFGLIVSFYSCASSDQHKQDEVVAVVPASVPISAPALEVHVAEHAAPAEHVEGIDPDKAMAWLQHGNTRFVKGKLRKDGQSHKDIARLSSGQHPHSILITCSDSRVPPEVVFDQKLGEVFVVRTAGEALDPTSVASVEYAVAHLGARNIVVMGHTQCGAVKATLSVMKGAEADTPNIAKLVADISPRLRSFEGRGPASVDYKDEVWANTKGVASDLVGRSALIGNALKNGEVKINVGVYDLNTGKVSWE